MPDVHRIGFTELLGSADTTSDAQRVNIIFVHGLRGHPEETWTSISESGHKRARGPSSYIKSALGSQTSPPESDGVRNNVNEVLPRVFWPRDYLAQDLPQARVWTYGYDAEVIDGVFQANNKNSVSQHGRDLAIKFERDIDNEDPVVFVAHSLGGIVVKDAIRRSEVCCLRTRLIVFLGTPHRGSEWTGWGEIASNLARLGLQDSHKKIIEALEVNSEVLDNIHEQFTSIVWSRGILIHSFQEARGISGMKGLHEKVVSDFSSKLDLPRALETVETINANHMQMARPNDRADERYRVISGVLKHFLRKHVLDVDVGRNRQSISRRLDPQESREEEAADTEEGEQTNSTKATYSIPFLRNRRFVGREGKLEELERKFFLSNDGQKLALVGLGGTGKTQIALQFAYIVKNRWPDCSIYWVPALSAESFEQAYGEIARVCSIQINPGEDLKKSVQRYLSGDRAGKWLLIVDNSDDREILFGTPDGSPGIVQYLPENENGLTLFTTRHGEMAQSLAGSDTIDILEMDPEEAEIFLKASLKGVELLQDTTIITELLKELTYLPLAITQAVAYMNSMKLPIKEYLRLLRNRDQNTVALLSREFYDNTRYKNIKNAVAATWLVSFDQIRESDPAAADILCFISFIENKAISKSILPPAQSNEEMTHAIGTLCAYAFIAKHSEGEKYDMHRLVHLATRVWMDKYGIILQWRKRAVAHLEMIFPGDDWSNREIWREYSPHAIELLRNTEAWGSNERCDLCSQVGRWLYIDARYGEAIMWLAQAGRWDEEHFAEGHPRRLKSQHVLGGAYVNDGQARKAVRLLENVVKIEEVLAEDSPSRLASQHELGRAYIDNGQIRKAIQLLENVVRIKGETFTEDHPNVLTSQHVLASALLADGQVTQAVELLEHVVTVQGRLLPEDHPNLLTSQHELASALLTDGQVTQAVELLEHVVTMQEGVLAEDHSDLLISQHELARAYEATSQIDKAKLLIEHVVSVRRESLAEDHPYRLQSEELLSYLYEEQRSSRTNAMAQQATQR